MAVITSFINVIAGASVLLGSKAFMDERISADGPTVRKLIGVPLLGAGVLGVLISYIRNKKVRKNEAEELGAEEKSWYDYPAEFVDEVYPYESHPNADTYDLADVENEYQAWLRKRQRPWTPKHHYITREEMEREARKNWNVKDAESFNAEDDYEAVYDEMESKLRQRMEDGQRPSDIDLSSVVFEITNDAAGRSEHYSMLMSDGREMLRYWGEEEDDYAAELSQTNPNNWSLRVEDGETISINPETDRNHHVLRGRKGGSVDYQKYIDISDAREPFVPVHVDVQGYDYSDEEIYYAEIGHVPDATLGQTSNNPIRIVIGGPPHSGKSTLMNLVEDKMRQYGVSVELRDLDFSSPTNLKAGFDPNRKTRPWTPELAQDAANYFQEDSEERVILGDSIGLISRFNEMLSEPADVAILLISGSQGDNEESYRAAIQKWRTYYDFTDKPILMVIRSSMNPDDLNYFDPHDNYGVIVGLDREAYGEGDISLENACLEGMVFEIAQEFDLGLANKSTSAHLDVVEQMWPKIKGKGTWNPISAGKPHLAKIEDEYFDTFDERRRLKEMDS